MQVLETIEKFYSSDKIVKFYSEKSLFPDERIVFSKYLTQKGRILDLCCGAGRAAFPLSEMGFEVIGVDINERLIKAARKRASGFPNTGFILSDIEKVEFPENYFDYILILHNSLESIPKNKKRNNILRKLNRCLKKEGLLIATFHSAYFPLHVVAKLIASNIKNINNSHIEYNDFFYKKDGLFYHVFPPWEILKAFKKNHFKIHAVHSSRELFAGDNAIYPVRDKTPKVSILPLARISNGVKKFMYKLLIPFDYTFWVFKKKD